MDDERFARLSERQKAYLRLAAEHRTSHDIAFTTGAASSRAVDKQLGLATKRIGATSRFEAARRFVEYEARVESFDPIDVPIAPSRGTFWPLPFPLPSRNRPINMLTRQQVLAWGTIIAVGAPVGITVAAMVIVSITLLLGIHLG